MLELKPCSTSPYADVAQRRRSVRGYLPDDVPTAIVRELLATARQAPSGANLQPGRFWAVQGDTRVRLSDTLCHAWREQVPAREDYDYFPDPMPMPLRKRQVAAAQALYGALGVDRRDVPGRRAQFERNFRFFDAPVALVVTIDRGFGSGGFMDLGMCLHSLMMAAADRGLGCCAIGALAMYPHLVRDTLALPDDDSIVCGIALGWPDPAASVNRTQTAREPLDHYFQVLG